eukprot:15075997-Ditylum_brightwellii.AAC.1
MHTRVKNNKTNNIYATIADLGGVIYTDQMGQFPRVSSQRNQYIMVVHCYDTNHIEGVHIKSWSEREFQQAYEGVYDMLTKKGTNHNCTSWTMKCPGT